MNDSIRKSTVLLAVYLFCFFDTAAWSQTQTETPSGRISGPTIPAPGSRLPALAENKVITEVDCTAAKLSVTIPIPAFGEPVSGVTLNAPVWTSATNSTPAYCSVNGSMAPVDTGANAKPINFRVVLPASWSHRAAQMGGGGMNGSIPNLLAGADQASRTSLVQLGFATYGSDSGHQSGFGPGVARGMGGRAGRDTVCGYVRLGSE